MKKSIDNLLKLTNFELDRVSKFLYGLMGFTLLINLIGYIYPPLKFMSEVNAFTSLSDANSSQAIAQFGTYSFYDAINSFWIYGPVAIGISGLLFYSVFTWYREWFGKNTFAYRLMMLPIPRMYLFFSKLITIFISIFSLISTQIISLLLGYPIVKTIIGTTYSSNHSLMEAVRMNSFFIFVLPLDLKLFLTILGIGFVVLLVLFTIILFERSYGVKGIIYGVFYGLFTLVLTLLPLFIPDLLKNLYILYPSELLVIEITFLTIIALFSIYTSRHLINKKITI